MFRTAGSLYRPADACVGTADVGRIPLRRAQQRPVHTREREYLDGLISHPVWVLQWVLQGSSCRVAGCSQCFGLEAQLEMICLKSSLPGHKSHAVALRLPSSNPAWLSVGKLPKGAFGYLQLIKQSYLWPHSHIQNIQEIMALVACGILSGPNETKR